MNFLGFLFSFKGRIRRGKFWLGLIIASLLLIPYAINDIYTQDKCKTAIEQNLYSGDCAEFTNSDAFANTFTYGYLLLELFGVLGFIISIWIQIAIAVKRVHDMGYSGWYGLLALLSGIGIFWVAGGASDPNENKYGRHLEKQTTEIKLNTAKFDTPSKLHNIKFDNSKYKKNLGKKSVILGLLGWLLPLVGIILAIAGLVTGIKGRKESQLCTLGIILSVIALTSNLIIIFGLIIGDSEDAKNAQTKSESKIITKQTSPEVNYDNDRIVKLVTEQIRQCWVLPKELENKPGLLVEVDVDIANDGNMKFVGFADGNKDPSDQNYWLLANSVLSALLNPNCNPLRQLPPADEYSVWGKMTIIFDSKN